MGRWRWIIPCDQTPQTVTFKERITPDKWLGHWPDVPFYGIRLKSGRERIWSYARQEQLTWPTTTVFKERITPDKWLDEAAPDFNFRPKFFHPRYEPLVRPETTTFKERVSSDKFLGHWPDVNFRLKRAQPERLPFSAVE